MCRWIPAIRENGSLSCSGTPGALLLLTEQRLRARLQAVSPDVRFLCLDADWDTIDSVAD